MSADIVFSTQTLELTSVRKIGSIITMWAEEPSFSNATGKASFEGVILNPGFSGSQGKIATLSFRVKKKGVAIVTITSGSVLANDGEATNVLATLGSASFTTDGEYDDKLESPIVTSNALPPNIRSTSYPDSTKWYTSKDGVFDWDLPPDVTAVRTLYDDDITSNPARIYSPPIANRSFVVDGEGELYMHVQFQTEDGWGEVSHYKFQIDTKPPTDITATFPEGSVTNNPKPSILVVATDTLSGIGNIGLTVDDDKEELYPYVASNMYLLPKKNAGKHSVLVNAYDKAGNKVSTKVDYTIDQITVPTVTDYTKNVELGNPFVVTGTTYPQAIIEVTLTDTNGTPLSQSTTADQNGTYSLGWAKKLNTGVYEMRLRAIDSKGAVSEYTEIKVVKVDHIPLIRFGIFIMNWLSLILVSILSLVAIMATFWYSIVQFSKFRRRVRRSMREAETTLKANVLGLRMDTEEFHTLLLKAEKKRELTKEESAILKKFKKRLDVTEREIEKKLEEIG